MLPWIQFRIHIAWIGWAPWLQSMLLWIAGLPSYNPPAMDWVQNPHSMDWLGSLAIIHATVDWLASPPGADSFVTSNKPFVNFDRKWRIFSAFRIYRPCLEE